MREGTPGSTSTHRSRRLRRLEQTQEIQIRTTHRRRKLLTRSGVLAGFALAMVVYPIMGTIDPYAGAAESVPGVVTGESPSTARALLGAGPQLVSSELPLPSPDSASVAMAVSANYTVSQHLPDCDPGTPWSGTNGELTSSSLCSLWNGEQLRADAAVALAELNHRFNLKFGRDLCIGEGYRSLSKQYAIKRSRGFLAATPGTSVHGWGLAFDLCGGDDRGATKAWLEANGPAWGWVNPPWAKATKWEPWHWEYLPGTDELNIYGSGRWASDGANGATSSASGSTSSGSSGSTSSGSSSSSSSSSSSTPTPEPEPEPTRAAAPAADSETATADDAADE